MNARVLISIWLVGMGLILALLPNNQTTMGQLKPSELVEKMKQNDGLISVDQLARLLVNEDSTILLIDLRSPDEYKECNIPGSVNIPYAKLMDKEFGGYLEQNEMKRIFYSNSEIISTQAWVLVAEMGYKNTFILQGGMNSWYQTVMNGRFEGERITARENALFETRMKARNLFIETNSLPDSIRFQFKIAKQKNRKKLDGGCG
ncbi:MAG: hypothetical protein A2W95_08290 [Bacteroidetes bacterium GWA2_40_14]|nr:MAG: hypothetical protein A2W95_08290 [Bacteroidetes bacterium GWA2_40_14]HAZ04394.1 hypothetical protein [Marinilabiliales bacterium]